LIEMLGIHSCKIAEKAMDRSQADIACAYPVFVVLFEMIEEGNNLGRS